MNRSGNIGAAKNMDTVFANFTDDELEQDLIFDEDDQLVEIVEGYTEDGNTIFEEDEEIFKIAHQVANDDNDTPAEVKKDTEDLLGPDNDTDQKISGIEDVEKRKIDDDQTYDQLKKNGESEADKELGLDKLEDEYHSSATVEEAYEKWLMEGYEYENDDKAEGSDTKFGDKELDNSAMPADDIKPDEDEQYNSTNDPSVELEAFLLEAATLGVYSITESKFSFEKLKNVVKKAGDAVATTAKNAGTALKIGNNRKDYERLCKLLKEAEEVLNDNDMEPDSKVLKTLNIATTITSVLVSLATFFKGIHKVFSSGTIIGSVAKGGVCILAIHAIGFANQGAVTANVSLQLKQCLKKLNELKAELEDGPDKDKVQETIDKIEKQLSKFKSYKKDDKKEDKEEEVKEAYEYENDDKAEGSDTKFGDKELDNSAMPAEDIKPDEDEQYNSTNDASTELDEAFRAWLEADMEEETKEECDCGSDECPICSKRKELAPDSSPIEDKDNDERHEESSGEELANAGEEGMAPNNVDDNTLPREDDMIPDDSPESDNGDITDDGPIDDKTSVENAEKVDEAFEQWLIENDLEIPLAGGKTPILPEDVEKVEDDLEKSAPESDAEIKTEGCCGKGSGTVANNEADGDTPNANAQTNNSTDSSEDSNAGDPSIKDVDEAFDAWLHEEDAVANAERKDSSNNNTEAKAGDAGDPALDEAFSSWLHEEEEVEAPTASDVADAADTEVEDTEGEVDDAIAAYADEDDSESDDVGLDYDPSDEDLIDLASDDDTDV